MSVWICNDQNFSVWICLRLRLWGFSGSFLYGPKYLKCQNEWRANQRVNTRYTGYKISSDCILHLCESFYPIEQQLNAIRECCGFFPWKTDQFEEVDKWGETKTKDRNFYIIDISIWLSLFLLWIMIVVIYCSGSKGRQWDRTLWICVTLSRPFSLSLSLTHLIVSKTLWCSTLCLRLFWCFVYYPCLW